jgi:NADPH2:quinone reductase
MKAARVHAFGPIENLVIEDIPVPVPGEGQVLIKVEACGLVFGDILTRKGIDPRPPERMPYTPGMEVAGVVEQLGPGVQSVKPGQRVMAFMFEGGNAEYAVADVSRLVALPDEVSDLQGLTYLINMPIAWLVHQVYGPVKPGDTILLHAAAGALGTLITHIAKRRNGNRVIALVSSDEKSKWCIDNGADHVINYRKTDYVDEVLRLTDGQGVDVSLNSVAGPTLQTDPRAIRAGGRWGLYGYSAGGGLIDPFAHAIKSLTIKISVFHTYAAQPVVQQAMAFRDEWMRTEKLIPAGKTFSLDDVREAHAWLEGQHTMGKTALVIGG